MVDDARRENVDADLQLGLPVDGQEYGVGAQILADLGPTQIRLLSSNARKLGGLERYGLTVVEQVALVSEPNPESVRYLRTKRDRLAHEIDRIEVGPDAPLALVGPALNQGTTLSPRRCRLGEPSGKSGTPGPQSPRRGMNHLSSHRRLAALVGMGAAAMLLAACGSSSSGGTISSSAAPSTSGSSSAAATGIDVGTGTITPKNTDKIAYMVQAGKTFSYTNAQAQAAIDKGKELGVAVDVYYSDLDPAKELANFQQAFTSGKYGGLIVQSVTPQLCKTIESDSVKNQILVEVVGNPLCDQATAVGEDLWSKGTMTYMGGQNGVDGITDLLNASAQKQTGPQKVMLVLGTKGHPSSTAWEVAFKKFQETHSDWTLANTVYTDFTTPGAFSSVQNALQANKDVTVAYSLYIDVTAGVAKALNAQGLTGKVALYENGGGSKVSVDLIGKGQIQGSLPVYPASLGSEGVKVMVGGFKGTQPSKFIPGDGNPDYKSRGVITKANVGSFTPQW